MPKFTPRRLHDGSPMNPVAYFPMSVTVDGVEYQLALHRAIGDPQKGMARWAISDPVSGRAIRHTLPIRTSNHKVAEPVAREVLATIVEHQTPARFAAVINAARAAFSTAEEN